MNDNGMTFEQAIKRLDEIISRFDAGNMALDESIALYEEGAKLSAYCRELLENTQQRVTELETPED